MSQTSNAGKITNPATLRWHLFVRLSVCLSLFSFFLSSPPPLSPLSYKASVLCLIIDVVYISAFLYRKIGSCLLLILPHICNLAFKL